LLNREQTEVVMRVELAKLKPNPTRDFTVDPIVPEIVRQLVQSIQDDGFWGGVVCRQTEGGEIQIAAGHHRVEAARKAGITHADLVVEKNMDDARMCRIYARENATQRGGNGLPRIGCVAAAIRTLFTDKCKSMCSENTTHGVTVIDEPGLRTIAEFLDGVPGISEDSIRQDLKVLHSSGDYARIVAEVRSDIEGDSPKVRAEKAAAAKEKAQTFDLQGVGQYLKTSLQIERFRESVTSPGIAPILPLEQQAPLAKEIADSCAKRTHREISAQEVRDEIGWRVTEARWFKIREDKDAMRRARLADLQKDREEALNEFRLAIWRVEKGGREILDVIKRYRKEKQKFFVDTQLIEAVMYTKQIIDRLEESINRYPRAPAGANNRGKSGTDPLVRALIAIAAQDKRGGDNGETES
jgi:hypothetical protein